MISPAHAQLMARYNRWQNQNLFGAAETLTDEDRRAERGAFFGSIMGTLNHILWADLLWLSRFEGGERPPQTNAQSPRRHEDWQTLRAERTATDQRILDWAGRLTPQDLGQDLVWHSALYGGELRQPMWRPVAHFFNHQTHHRGQVHALLTAAGVRPDDTDLMLIA